MTFIQAITLFVIVVILNVAWNYHARNKSESNATVTKVRPEPSEQSSGTDKQATETNYLLVPMVLIVMFLLLMGIWAINYWLREYNMAADSLNWDVVPGEIISKDIQRSASSSRLSNDTKTYVPSVEYTFTYKGKKYKGTNIDYSNSPAYGDTSKSQAVLNSLPDVGQKIDVYVSPDLKHSCLLPGPTNSNPFGIIVGTFLLFIGVAGLKKLFGF
jgi:hypothetical protein